MKELELTLRLRNNRLKQRRDALGMTQAALAAAAGVGVATYQELEGLRRSPQVQGAFGGRWREVALQLARFHCVEPEVLFPPSVLKVETPVASRKVDGDDLSPLLTQHQQRLLEAPDVAHDREELREQVAFALSRLSPREAQVLRLRFGLDGDGARTFDEIGAVLEVGKERVRQIEAKALRTLRHPKRCAALVAFNEPSAEASHG